MRLDERSDHENFRRRGIPSLSFYTGSHTDYHEATDDAEKLNYQALSRISQLALDLARALADAPLAQRPSDTELKTAMSSADAPISAANATLASRTSSIHASQSIPARFHDSRYRSAAARVASVCGLCEQLFMGTIPDAIRGMRCRSVSMS